MSPTFTRDELGTLNEALEAYLDQLVDARHHSEGDEGVDFDLPIEQTEALLRKVTEALIG